MESQPLVTISINRTTATILKAQLNTMLEDKERRLPQLEGKVKSHEDLLSKARQELGIVKAEIGMIKNTLLSLSKTVPHHATARGPAR